MKTIGPLIGVVVAVVIAWWLVSVLFSLVWLVAKVIIVAVVAVVAVLVYFALRGVFASGSRAD
ncbi:MAG: hypothetical protein ACOH19_08990 [Rhodoglobus sp.]